MISLTITVQERGELDRDVITFKVEGTATDKEKPYEQYFEWVRKGVCRIATQTKAATKYKK